MVREDKTTWKSNYFTKIIVSVNLTFLFHLTFHVVSANAPMPAWFIGYEFSEDLIVEVGLVCSQ